MSSTPTQVYPSVDWITLTTGVSPDADEAYQRARALSVEQIAAGDRLRPWGANGYKGFSTPHLRCGHRDGDVAVELSGGLADRYWQQFYPLAKNVSRLDTCVTVTFPHEVQNLARDGRDAPRRIFRPGLPPIRKVLWEQVDGGQTLYLGSPKSARFGRLYDKTAESQGAWAPNSWRWELQERRDKSRHTADALYGVDDLHSAIRTYVRDFYTFHGVTPWFDADGVSLRSPTRRARTDWQQTEQWLLRGVAPTLRRWRDAGYGDAIDRALKLDGGDPR